MAPDTLAAYVRSALAAQDYRLDQAQTGRVIEQFSRFDAIAQGFLNVPLPFDLEPAAVFRL
jgi:hypothetical protein